MNTFEIDRRHTVFFFIAAVVVCAYGVMLDLNTILKQYPKFVSVACFFLIATIGVSHGALDNLKGKKLLKKYRIKNISFFYLIYSLISILIIMFWIFIPSITFFSFLIIASYHFGKEDNVKFYSFEKLPNIKFKFIFLFFKGSLVISAPLWLHPEETLQIFKILNFSLIHINENLILYNKNYEFIYRKEDTLCWKFSKKGFFNFKKHIPYIIKEII